MEPVPNVAVTQGRVGYRLHTYTQVRTQTHVQENQVPGLGYFSCSLRGDVPTRSVLLHSRPQATERKQNPAQPYVKLNATTPQLERGDSATVSAPGHCYTTARHATQPGVECAYAVDTTMAQSTQHHTGHQGKKCRRNIPTVTGKTQGSLLSRCLKYIRVTTIATFDNWCDLCWKQ